MIWLLAFSFWAKGEEGGKEKGRKINGGRKEVKTGVSSLQSQLPVETYEIGRVIIVPVDFVTSKTGDFLSPATWVGGVVPNGCAIVHIAAGHTLQISTVVNIKDLVFDSVNTGLRYMNVTAKVNTGICP